ncbi:MAG: helix-turn-helix domain-containing protein [Planctomycetes bacterium]|nr:helix-turn-helix domain-containing protein [Planctomycetota bacterium]
MSTKRILKTLDRGLTAFEMIAGSGDGITLQDLARKMALPATTVHPLVASLAARGYVERIRGPVRYRLGKAAVRITEMQQRSELMQRAGDVMLETAGRFPGATVSFAQAEGGDVMQKLRISGTDPGVLQKYCSRTLDPYGTASGLVLQAFLPDDDRILIWEAHPLQERTGGRKQREELERAIAECRGRGYARIQPGGGPVYAVAAPVFGKEGPAEGALGMSAPVRALMEKDFAAILNATLEGARKISGGK